MKIQIKYLIYGILVLSLTGLMTYGIYFVAKPKTVSKIRFSQFKDPSEFSSSIRKRLELELSQSKNIFLISYSETELPFIYNFLTLFPQHKQYIFLNSAGGLEKSINAAEKNIIVIDSKLFELAKMQGLIKATVIQFFPFPKLNEQPNNIGIDKTDVNKVDMGNTDGGKTYADKTDGDKTDSVAQIFNVRCENMENRVCAAQKLILNNQRKKRLEGKYSGLLEQFSKNEFIALVSKN